MTEKAITTAHVKLPTPEPMDIRRFMAIVSDTIQHIEDERLTVEQSSTEVCQGKSEFDLKLVDEKGYKQNGQLDVVAGLSHSVMEFPSDAATFEYSTNRIDVEKEEGDVESNDKITMESGD